MEILTSIYEKLTDHLAQHFQLEYPTENTATIIDNIFSNIIQEDITSENILFTLSGIFPNLYL